MAWRSRWQQHGGGEENKITNRLGLDRDLGREADRWWQIGSAVCGTGKVKRRARRWLRTASTRERENRVQRQRCAGEWQRGGFAEIDGDREHGLCGWAHGGDSDREITASRLGEVRQNWAWLGCARFTAEQGWDRKAWELELTPHS